MQQGNEAQSGSGVKPDQVARVFGLAIEGAGTAAAVFLRRGFGRQYLGMRAAAGFVLILLYSALWSCHIGRESPGPMVLFLIAYLAMCLIHRGRSLAASLGGGHTHSHYDGHSVLRRLLPFVPEAHFKRLVDPLICMTTGCFLLAVSAPLGTYLMVAGFGLLSSGVMRNSRDQSRLRRWKDSVIEQRNLSESFGSFRGK